MGSDLKDLETSDRLVEIIQDLSFHNVQLGVEFKIMDISDRSALEYAGSELNSGEDICAHMTYTEVLMQLSTSWTKVHQHFAMTK